MVSRLSAAQPVPQAILRAAGAVIEDRCDIAGAPAATPPSREARRATKQSRMPAAPKPIHKGKRPAIKRERVRAKKPRKIAALRSSDPDWPWPLPYSYLRLPIWKQQMFYRSMRLWNRREGITGPDEERRALIRQWREENGC